MNITGWQLIMALLAVTALGGIALAIKLRNSSATSLAREQKTVQELLNFPLVNPHPVLEVSKLGVLIYANPASTPILLSWQTKPKEKIPPYWRDIVRQALYISKSLENEINIGNVHYALTIVPLAKEGVVIFGKDITQQKQIEQQLTELTTTDPLTKLPNRILFQQNLALEIKHVRLAHKKLGLIIIRLDDYFEITNTYGQNFADLLIKAFVQRIQNFTGEKSIIARLSDNKFGVMDIEIQDPNEMANYVEELINKSIASYQINERTVFIALSIGIAFYPGDGESAESLIRNAQLAVNRTSSARNQFEFFQRGMVEQLAMKRELIADLHKAIEEQQFILYYQPQIHLKSKKMVSCESLIRWQHPEKGFISPRFFMTIAEQTHLIIPIGEWVLKAACRQILKWQAQELPPIKVAVNISARQLFQGNIVKVVADLLQETKIPPHQLELELTESALAQDMDKAIEIMKDLKSLGVELALDDFGTGYSSLSYLMKFPIDKLKVDQSFVKVINSETEEYALTKGIINLAKNLKLIVIAEGAETQTQINFLKKNECDLIQGYYFSKPITAEEMVPLFTREWTC